MELLPDLSNLPKPHLVFKATEFCENKDWVGKRDSPGQQLERDLWSKDVIVSFQENAWVDARTTIYSLQEQTNLEKGLQQADIKNPQIFEDCLAAHTTPEQCPSKWGPRGPVAPGTGDPGPLENGQEIPAGGPRPGATRAPLGARCRAS